MGMCSHMSDDKIIPDRRKEHAHASQGLKQHCDKNESDDNEECADTGSKSWFTLNRPTRYMVGIFKKYPVGALWKNPDDLYIGKALKLLVVIRCDPQE